MPPSPASVQQRAAALQAAQGSPREDHLLQSPITACEEHDTGTRGLSVVFRLEFDNGAEAFLKPWGGRQTGSGMQSYLNVNSCLLHGHHPDEIPLNEATAWRLAQRLGGTVEEVVAPCVLLDVPAYGLAGSVSARRYGIRNTTKALTRSTRQAMAAAFFDSLIAQQDRHQGNYRWNEPPWASHVPHQAVRSLQRLSRSPGLRPVGLGLLDHGFCFARPGDFVRDDKRSVFVEWRHGIGRPKLTDSERAALLGLAADPTLHGAAQFLESDRAAALADRTSRMLKRGSILDIAEW